MCVCWGGGGGGHVDYVSSTNCQVSLGKVAMHAID